MSKARVSVLLLAAASIIIGVTTLSVSRLNQGADLHSDQGLPGKTSAVAGVKSFQTVSKLPSPSSSAQYVVPAFDNRANDLFLKRNTRFSQLKYKYNLLVIPTYDGLNQLTHPKVLYFPKGWNGYRYWMSMTPYPYGRDRYENPSIVVSNDGEKWMNPPGIKNPISGIPNDIKYGGHYSDPHLVMSNNIMELWYRYNPGNPITRTVRNNINIYLRKTSTDGIHWSAPQQIFRAKDGHLSAAIIYENSIYKKWYTDYSGHLFYSQSGNAIQWTSPVKASIPLPKGYQAWHQDVIKADGMYFLLQCAEKPSNYTFAEFFASSKDGLHFTNVKRIYPSANINLWNNVSFYRSTMFQKDNKIEMYLSTILPGKKWYMTRREFSIQDLLAPAKDFSIARGADDQILSGIQPSDPKLGQNPDGSKSVRKKAANEKNVIL